MISDIRFVDEAKEIKKMGGIIIKIDREINDNKPDNKESKHKSENEIKKISHDYLIMNDSNQEKLYENFDNIYQNIINKKYLKEI